jgi:hypothetical protein
MRVGAAGPSLISPPLATLALWWVQCENADETSTKLGTVAELETVNGHHDAAWIALMAPAVVGPLLLDALQRAAAAIAWSRGRPCADVAESPAVDPRTTDS